MKTTSSVAGRTSTGAAILPMGNFLYKTIAIYPDFANVGAALALLKNNGFPDDQISLLGREQEHWQKNLNLEWNAIHTAKGTLGGAALGSIPGLILVAGTALTGGVGLLVAGPMAALGLGALSGGLMGAVASNDANDHESVDVEKEVEDAIGRGQWVIVAHSHDHAGAIRAQELLHNARIVHEIGVTDETAI